MALLYHLLKHARTLAVAFLLVCVLVGGLVGLALARSGQTETPTSSESPAVTASDPSALAQPPAAVDVDRCEVCHPDIVKDWKAAPHSHAFSDEAFQAAWAGLNNDPECLDCHTSGYTPATGTYEAEGVTCEECHGAIPDNHPEQSVNLDIANQVCRDCHTVTYAEFRSSMHAAEGLKCTSCHYAHTNGLRLGTQLAQCLNCHGNQLDDFAHASHLSVDSMVCRDCHGYVKPGFEPGIDGQTPTGHDFKENVTACLDCHQSFQLTVANEGTTPSGNGFNTAETQQLITSGQKAQLRVTQLEALIQTLTLEQRNFNVIGVIGGGIGGLLVGGLVTAVIARRRIKVDEFEGEGGSQHGWS